MENDKLIEIDFFKKSAEEIEEEEILETRKSSEKPVMTYEDVFERGRKLTGIKKVYKDGKAFGYEAVFCYGYEDVYDEKKKKMIRKQIKEKKSFLRKEDAVKWYNDLKKKKEDLKDKGQRIIRNGYTVLEVCDMYYEECRLNKRSKGYLQQLRGQKDNHFAKFFIGKKAYVKHLTTQDIKDYFRFEESNGRCKESIQKYKSHLKMMWDYMLDNDKVFQIDRNIVEPAIVQADESEFESIALNYSQLVDYLNEMLQVEDPSYLYLFVFAYFLGMRRGEIAGLQWQDINWENKTIIIRHNRVQRTKQDKLDDDYDDVDERNVKLPKTGYVRKIELHKLAYDTICVYKKWQEKILNRPVNPEDFVLQFELNLVNGYDPNVSKISVRWRECRDRINKLRAKAEKEPLIACRLHDGRETCGTLMLDGVLKPDGTKIEPVNRYQVYSHLGHSYRNVENNTTETVYHKKTDERWDVTRFWNELITIDIKNAWENYEEIRQFEWELLREEKKIKEQKKKENRFKKAKMERDAAKEEENILVEYVVDDESV